MEGLRHDPDTAHGAHLEVARRVLALPASASGLHWHPFGVYAIPLAKRSDAVGTWSRRLHIWHPSGTPVGEASPYGVHTHTSLARSHVLVGALQHHIYSFEPDADGAWQKAELGDPRGRETLVAHVQSATRAGTTHSLPAHQPHGVGKASDFAVSLFEQLDTKADTQFTTWQRQDVPAETLVTQAPTPLNQVLVQARRYIDEALFLIEG